MTDTKLFGCRYDYADTAFAFALDAADHDDAEARMEAIRETGKVDGQIVEDVKRDQDGMEIKRVEIDCDLEIKAEGDDKGVFEGLASTFGNADLVGDVIERGAFAKSLKKRPAKRVKMLLSHNPMELPLGVFESMKETDDGLFVRGRLALDTQKGAEAFALMKMGAIDSMSIGFRADPAKQEFDERRRRRILKEIELFEVSLVNFPANPRARIGDVKAIALVHDKTQAGDVPTVREFERMLMQDAGFTRSQARTIIRDGFEALDPTQDAGDQSLGELVASIRDLDRRMAESAA